MGRAPCCDKANVKKGPWSPEEDAKLKSYIEQHGTGGNWIALPQKIGLKRCGKSCRLRWLNYLRPNIKHGGFSEEEDNIICSLYISIGSRWSIIAAQLPGRTDNDIKNYWNTRLKKKLLGNKQRKSHLRGTSSSSSTGHLMMNKKEIAKRPLTAGIMVNYNSMDQVMMSNSTIVSDQIINPYWPELPVLQAAPLQYSSELQPRCDDHASIRKLLIKLGGRFSDGDHHHDHDNISTQPPIINGNIASGTTEYPTQVVFPHVYHEFSGNVMISASAPPPEFGPHSVQYNDTSTHTPSTTTTAPLVAAELEGPVYSENPTQAQMLLDGMEFLYSGINGSSCAGTEDISWGEMSSLLYSNSVPIISSASDHFEGVQREVLSSQDHHCIFGQSSFPNKAQ